MWVAVKKPNGNSSRQLPDEVLQGISIIKLFLTSAWESVSKAHIAQSRKVTSLTDEGRTFIKLILGQKTFPNVHCKSEYFFGLFTASIAQKRTKQNGENQNTNNTK